MNSEDRVKFTGFMGLFSSQEPVCESSLLRKYKQEKIDEALEKGFIKVYDINDINETRYIITDEGKKFW